MGPTIGGAVAGLLSWVHSSALLEYGPPLKGEIVATKAAKREEIGEDTSRLLKNDNEKNE